MKIRRTAHLHQNGEGVVVRTSLVHDDHDHFIDAATLISETFVSVREEGVKQALIALGWTPPKEG